jgi:predicted membrane-bound dolichyl-phosphate-mannose-protein mannosyltransferase
LVVFFAAREMFGTGAAFVALTLLAFDPNLLAHGALITTDVGLACFMFLSIYMFYRCSDWLVGLVVLLQVSLRRAA